MKPISIAKIPDGGIRWNISDIKSIGQSEFAPAVIDLDRYGNVCQAEFVRLTRRPWSHVGDIRLDTGTCRSPRSMPDSICYDQDVDCLLIRLLPKTSVSMPFKNMNMDASIMIGQSGEFAGVIIKMNRALADRLLANARLVAGYQMVE